MNRKGSQTSGTASGGTGKAATVREKMLAKYASGGAFAADGFISKLGSDVDSYSNRARIDESEKTGEHDIKAMQKEIPLEITNYLQFFLKGACTLAVMLTAFTGINCLTDGNMRSFLLQAGKSMIKKISR